jgi:hypothetical protein
MQASLFLRNYSDDVVVGPSKFVLPFCGLPVGSYVTFEPANREGTFLYSHVFRDGSNESYHLHQSNELPVTLADSKGSDYDAQWEVIQVKPNGTAFYFQNRRASGGYGHKNYLGVQADTLKLIDGGSNSGSYLNVQSVASCDQEKFIIYNHDGSKFLDYRADLPRWGSAADSIPTPWYIRKVRP